MANFCKHCGIRIDSDTRFCPNCGQPVSLVPAQAAPRNSVRPAPGAPRRSAGGRSLLNIILAVIFLVEACYACFIRPGFLARKPADQSEALPGIILTPPESDENNANRPGSIEETFIVESTYHDTAQQVINKLSGEEKRELSPAAPGSISLSFTREEIEAIKPERVTVSPDEPVCEVGGITVDFKKWNLDEEETLLVRSVGAVYDSNSGSTLELYDFSLESGKDRFATEVDISLPRPQGGNANGVVWYDMVNDIWRPTVYDISADGKNYILHTDHFSLFGPEASDYIKPEMLTADISNGLFCTGFTAEERSYISNSELWNRKIILSDERLTALYQAALKDQSFISRLLASGNITPEASLKGGWTEFFGSKYGFVDKWHSMISVITKTGAGKYFLAGSGLFLASKVLYQWGYEDVTVSNLLAEYKYDLAGVTVGVIAAAFLPEVGVAATCAAIGGAIISWGQDIEDKLKYKVGWQGDVYQHFLQNETEIRPYKDALFNVNGVRLKLDGTGWADEISMLAEKMKSGEYDYMKSQPGGVSFDRIIEERIDKYLNSFWDMDVEDEFKEGIHEYYQNLYVDYLRKPTNETEKLAFRAGVKWEEPTPEQREKIIGTTKALLMKNTREIIYAVYKKHVDEVTQDYKEELQTFALPFLNSTIILEVNDEALKDGESFGSDSAYAEDPDAVVFSDLQDKPDYWPADMTANDYYRGKFHPYALEDSNEIFSCRMYYYMMYGSPTTLSFKGNKETGRMDASRSFAIPQDDLGRIIIEISVGEAAAAERKNEVYNLKIIQDETMGYYSKTLKPDYEELPGGKKPECTLAINEDGSVIMSFDDAEFEGEAYVGDKHYVYSNSRPGFVLEGQIYDRPGKRDQRCVITSVDQERIKGHTLWSIYWPDDPDHAGSYTEYTAEMSEIRMIPKEEVQNWLDGIYKGPKPSASQMTLHFASGRLIKMDLYLNSDEDLTGFKEDGKIDEDRGGHTYRSKKILLEVIP